MLRINVRPSLQLLHRLYISAGSDKSQMESRGAGSSWRPVSWRDFRETSGHRRKKRWRPLPSPKGGAEKGDPIAKMQKGHSKLPQRSLAGHLPLIYIYIYIYIYRCYIKSILEPPLRIPLWGKVKTFESWSERMHYGPSSEPESAHLRFPRRDIWRLPFIRGKSDPVNIRICLGPTPHTFRIPWIQRAHMRLTYSTHKIPDERLYPGWLRTS